MKKAVLGVLGVLFTSSPAVTFSQSGTVAQVAVDITDEQVKAVNAVGT